MRVNGWQSPKPISRSDLRAMTRQFGCIISPSRVLASFRFCSCDLHILQLVIVYSTPNLLANEKPISKYQLPRYTVCLEIPNRLLQRAAYLYNQTKTLYGVLEAVGLLIYNLQFWGTHFILKGRGTSGYIIPA